MLSLLHHISPFGGGRGEVIPCEGTVIPLEEGAL